MNANQLPCLCPYVCIKCELDKKRKEQDRMIKQMNERGEMVVDKEKQNELIDGITVGNNYCYRTGCSNPNNPQANCQLCRDSKLFVSGERILAADPVNIGDPIEVGAVIKDSRNNEGRIEQISFNFKKQTKTMRIRIINGPYVGDLIERRIL